MFDKDIKISNESDKNIKEMDNWAVTAQWRIDDVNYSHTQHGCILSTPQILRDRNGYDLIFASTNGPDQTNICVVCFTLFGHFKVACGENIGLPGLSCCDIHKEAQKPTKKRKTKKQKTTSITATNQSSSLCKRFF